MTMLSSARRIIALTAAFLLVSASPAAAGSADSLDIITPIASGILGGLIGLFLAQEADPDGDYGRQGFYLKGGVGRAYNLFEEELPAGEVAENSHDINLRFGYRIFSRLALEAEWELATKFAVNAGGVEVRALQSMTGTGNLKGFLLTGPFQPYALFGLGVMNVSADDSVVGLSLNEDWTDLTLRMGGGFDFWANEHIAVSLEATYLRPTGDVKDFDYISYTVAFQYRF